MSVIRTALCGEARMDGSHKQQLTFQSFTVHLPRWSPDGNYIVFDGSKDGKTKKIFMISAAGGSPVEMLPGDLRQADPSWSARRQLYRLYRLRSQRRILVQSRAYLCSTVKTHDVSALPDSEGLLSPRWSPDGRISLPRPWIPRNCCSSIRRPGSGTILAHVAVGYLCWSKDSKYLYFDTFGTQPSIERIGIHDTVPEKVVGLEDSTSRLGSFWALVWIGT